MTCDIKVAAQHESRALPLLPHQCGGALLRSCSLLILLIEYEDRPSPQLPHSICPAATQKKENTRGVTGPMIGMTAIAGRGHDDHHDNLLTNMKCNSTRYVDRANCHN